jgi:hypothetical protein
VNSEPSCYGAAVTADDHIHSHTTAEWATTATAPKISAPRSHSTTKTTGTGSSKNLSYARPIAEDAGAFGGNRGRLRPLFSSCGRFWLLSSGGTTCFFSRPKRSATNRLASSGGSRLRHWLCPLL